MHTKLSLKNPQYEICTYSPIFFDPVGMLLMVLVDFLWVAKFLLFPSQWMFEAKSKIVKFK